MHIPDTHFVKNSNSYLHCKTNSEQRCPTYGTYQVTRAAEECAMLLARFIAPDRTIQVLLPMIESEEYPINLAAIKMMTQLIENSGSDAIVDFLPEMIPVLLKVSFRFNHNVHIQSLVLPRPV